MSKILVTGGMGYIGSHTIIELLENTDYEIVSIDSCINSSESTLEKIRKITGKSIRNHKIDLCNQSAIEDFFVSEGQIGGIIHFAALKSVPESVENPLKYYQNNVLSQINLLETSYRFGVKNFIFSSSCSIYGNVEKLPVDESTPFGKAESPYAYTKQVGETVLRDFARANPDFQAISLRYFNPVGADKSGLNGENPINKPTALVPFIVKVANGDYEKLTVFGTNYQTRDGSCVRDYIHVSDLADAHIKALEFLHEGRNETNYSVFNIGSGNGVTVLEAIQAFEEYCGQKLNYELGERRAGDVAAIYSNCSKAEKALGWSPKLGIKEMMVSAWEWEKKL